MKKERIKSKADELFRRYGVRSVTMDEICTHLGISKKTLYQFFDDKGELVDEVVRGLVEENMRNFMRCRKKSADAVEEVVMAMDMIENVLAGINPVVLYDLERGYPKSFKRFQEFRYDFLFDGIIDNIRWGKKDGFYREEINEEIYAKARLEMVALPFNEQLFPQVKFPLGHLQKELLELFLYSLVTPKGLRQLEKYKRKKVSKSVNPTQ